MCKRILVAVDGIETSNKALVEVLQLACDRDASLLLLHCVDELLLLTAGGVRLPTALNKKKRSLTMRQQSYRQRGATVRSAWPTCRRSDWARQWLSTQRSGALTWLSSAATDVVASDDCC